MFIFRNILQCVALNVNLKSQCNFSILNFSKKVKSKLSRPSSKYQSVSPENLEQKLENKITKLRKIGFSIQDFTANILQLLTKKLQNLIFGSTAVYSQSNTSISGIFLIFCSVTCKPTPTFTLS